jgi:hypothetical protein
MDEELEVREYPKQRRPSSRLYTRLFWGALIGVSVLVVCLAIWAFWARNNHQTSGEIDVEAIFQDQLCIKQALSAEARGAIIQGLEDFYDRYTNQHHISWLASCDFERYFFSAGAFVDVSTQPLSANRDYQRALALRETMDNAFINLSKCNGTLSRSGDRLSLGLRRLDLEFYVNLTEVDYFLPQFGAVPYNDIFFPDRITAASEALSVLMGTSDYCRGYTNMWRATNVSLFENRIVNWMVALGPAIADWQRGLMRQAELNKTHTGVSMEEQREYWINAGNSDFSTACTLITSQASLRTRCEQAAVIVNTNLELFSTYFDNIYIWSAAAMRPVNHDDILWFTDGPRIKEVLRQYHLRVFELYASFE